MSSISIKPAFSRLIKNILFCCRYQIWWDGFLRQRFFFRKAIYVVTPWRIEKFPNLAIPNKWCKCFLLEFECFGYFHNSWSSYHCQNVRLHSWQPSVHMLCITSYTLCKVAWFSLSFALKSYVVLWCKLWSSVPFQLVPVYQFYTVLSKYLTSSFHPLDSDPPIYGMCNR